MSNRVSPKQEAARHAKESASPSVKGHGGKGFSFQTEHQIGDPFEHPYTESPGKDGVTVAAKIHPFIKEAMTQLIASQKTLHKTDSDIVRTALTYYFEHAVGPKLGDGFAADWKNFQMHISGSRKRTFLYNVAQAVEKIAGTVNMFLRSNTMDAAVEEFNVGWDALEALPHPLNHHGIGLLLNRGDLAVVRELAAKAREQRAGEGE